MQRTFASRLQTGLVRTELELKCNQVLGLRGGLQHGLLALEFGSKGAHGGAQAVAAMLVRAALGLEGSRCSIRRFPGTKSIHRTP